MALSVNDFLAAAMLHPGAEAFSISKDETSKEDVVHPFAGVFHDTKISPENVEKGKKTLAVLRNALEEKFGKRATDCAWPSERYSLSAHEMTQVIKKTESTASKHAILIEGKHILSGHFIFSSDYLAPLHTLAEGAEPAYASSYRAVAEELDNYENEVAELTSPQKIERLHHIEIKAVALLDLQEAASSEENVAVSMKKPLEELAAITHLLLQGISSEIKLLQT